jgi:N6-adenosine-specific RNA methylase IME4
MNVLDIPVHPAADIFPMLDKSRHEDLKADIAAHGQRENIRMLDGKILDGRNRHLACVELGIPPLLQDLPEDTSPWSYVWSLNGQRRDLTQDQRYLIWLRCTEAREEWEEERAAIAEEANRKRAEAAKEQHKVSNPRAGEKVSGDSATSGATKPGRHSAPGSAQAATASNTNRGTVERMGSLATKRPDLAQEVVAGRLKAAAAMRLMKKDEVADKVAELPDDKYRVIYADPPWAYNDTRQTGDHRESTAAAHHYPTMSKKDICAMNVADMAADDCVLFLWGTFPLLPDALDVIRAWGFKYKTAIVWHKDGGAFGHYHKANAELLFIATKGSALPDADKKESQVIEHKRLGHSRKPECFREMIDRAYIHGPRIELFCRGPSAHGWTAWGNETI